MPHNSIRSGKDVAKPGLQPAWPLICACARVGGAGSWLAGPMRLGTRLEAPRAWLSAAAGLLLSGPEVPLGPRSCLFRALYSAGHTEGKALSVGAKGCSSHALALYCGHPGPSQALGRSSAGLAAPLPRPLRPRPRVRTAFARGCSAGLRAPRISLANGKGPQVPGVAGCTRVLLDSFPDAGRTRSSALAESPPHRDPAQGLQECSGSWPLRRLSPPPDPGLGSAPGRGWRRDGLCRLASGKCGSRRGAARPAVMDGAGRAAGKAIYGARAQRYRFGPAK